MVALGVVRETIGRMHGVDGGSALKPRFRHLNEDDFPPGHRVGTSRRADYKTEDVLAFVAHFALASAHVPPVVASRIVRDAWPEIVRCFIQAASKTSLGSPPLRHDKGTILCLQPNALQGGAAGSAARANGIGMGAWDLTTIDRDTPASDLPESLGAQIVLDVDRQVRTLLEAAPDELRSAMERDLPLLARRHDYAQEAVPSDRKIVKVRAAKVPNPEGERIGEADYFYSRAIDLISRSGQADISRPQSVKRLIRYLAQPFAREGWKRSAAIGDTGVQFLWGLTTYLEDIGMPTPMQLPETIATAIRSRLGGKEIDAATTKQVLLASARHLRQFEDVSQ